MHDDNPERGPAPPGVSPPPALPGEAPPWSAGAHASWVAPTEGPAGPQAPDDLPPFDPPPGPPSPPEAGDPSSGRPTQSFVGLGVWFAVLLAGGLGGLLLGAQDLAALTAVAGVFVTAHAADLDPRWRGLHQTLVATLCVVGAGLFAGMGVVAHSSDLPPMLRAAASIGAGVGAVACLVLIVPFVARDLARLLFRVAEPSHALRLGARLTVMAVMVGVVGSIALRGALEDMLDQGKPLLEAFAAGGSLAGYVIAAFASVGFLIRRDLRETLHRLGLRRPTFNQLVWIALGVVMLGGLNGGFDALEHRFLPSLWQSDQRVGEAIAGGLTPFQMAMVGVSAGIGEELTLRGALQPKLGIVLTSLVFALLHVQYSWFGMLVIFLFGIALGLLRRATSTTVVMAVHTLYDVLALMTN